MVDIKTMKVYMKIQDEFYAEFVDADNVCHLHYEGYVPSFMPGEHYGDYIDLHIDLDTGQILNWDRAKVYRLFSEFFDENEDADEN